MPFQADRIFSQAESGRPKTEVLAMLQQRHPKAKSLHFVEDKLSTLNKACTLTNRHGVCDAWSAQQVCMSLA